MIINLDNYSASQRYHLMTQTIIPRPIAWALTESDNGTINVAPFSYFTAVSSEPALLMISIGKKPNGEPKDTLVNTLAHKKIVIHIASEQQADLVTQTAASLPHGESELDIFSTTDAVLNTTDFDAFPLPRLAQCDIAFGCELFDTKVLGEAEQTLLFVKIEQVYINPKVMSLDDKDRIKVYADNVKPLARLGANEYTGTTPPFKVQRPK